MGLQMPPRQIQEAFRIFGHTFATEDPTKFAKLYWCIGVGTIMLAMIRVSSKDVYERIGKASISHEEFGRFLTEKMGTKAADWWFRVYLTGASRRWEEETVDAHTVLRNLKFVNGEFNPHQELGQFSEGWGGGSRIPDIFDRIETAQTF